MPHNDVGLDGQGSIEFAPGRVTLAGKRRRRSFRSAVPVNLNLSADMICDVLCYGNAVTFAVVPAAGAKPLKVGLAATDKDTAERIAAMLPETKTPHFAQSQVQWRSFMTSLYQSCPTATVTWALILINVAIFAAMVFKHGGLLTPNPEVVINWGANATGKTLGGQWWRLLTSMFLHFGLIHLALNMYSLFAIGPMVERMFGNLRYLMLYLGAGLVSGTASLWWHTQHLHTGVISAGASGAIFGVFGALLAFVLNPFNAVQPIVKNELFKSMIPVLVINLGIGQAVPAIDNAAHVGGLIGGVLLGLLLSRPLPAPRDVPAS